MKTRHPTLKEIFKSSPVDNEEMVFELPCQFICAEISAESWTRGVWFRTTERCGVAGDAGGYVCGHTISVSSISVDDSERVVTLVQPGEDPRDIAKYYTYYVKPDDWTSACNAFMDIRALRFLHPSPTIQTDLDEFRSLMERGKMVEALDRLRLAERLDPMCGSLDLLIARTLHWIGNSRAAATQLARVWQHAVYFCPAFVLCEFLKYDWHTGAVRYLPEANGDMSSEDALLLKAAQAKAAGEWDGFLSAFSLAFVERHKDIDNISPVSLRVFSDQLLVLATVDTVKDIKEPASVLLRFLRKAESAIVQDQAEDKGCKRQRHTLKERFSQFVGGSGSVEPAVNYDAVAQSEEMVGLRLLCSLLEKIATVEPNTLYDFLMQTLEVWCEQNVDLKTDLYFRQEAYANLAIMPDYPPPPPDLTGWDLASLIDTDDSLWKSACQYRRLEQDVMRLFAQLRIGHIDPPACSEKISRIMQLPAFALLKYDNPEIAWVAHLMLAETAIQQGLCDRAIDFLHEGQRAIGDNAGRVCYPLVRYVDEVAAFYEAWAFNCPLAAEETLQRIPEQHPLIWLHSLGCEVLSEYGRTNAITTESMQSKLRTLVNSFDGLAQSKFISSSVRADIITNKNHIETILEDPELRVAVGGETGAGKTTFLNRLFDTDLFFVTQEEATGVPTEIRRGNTLRVEVYDDNAVRDSIELRNGRDEYIPDTDLRRVKDYITIHTSLGSQALSWVSKVRVMLPIPSLPSNLVLIDTPGFNAHQARTDIAQQVISRSHACIFVLDARSALKRNVMELLSTTRDEVGRTFIVLNKMDAVIGDDELDCDGADAADGAVDNVRRRLADRFQLNNIQVHAVCSLAPETVSSDARRYTGNLTSFHTVLISETIAQKLDLLIDLAAKQAIAASEVVSGQVRSITSEHQMREHELVRARPDDMELFEGEILDRLRASIGAHREEYVEILGKTLDEEIRGCADAYFGWLEATTSKELIKNQAKSKAERIVGSMAKRVDIARRDCLTRMARQIQDDLVSIFRELYSNLPFKVTYDAKDFVNSLTDIVSASNIVGSSLSYSIDTGTDEAIGGGAFGAVLGSFILPGIGTVIGAWLGASLFGKSVDDLKAEIWQRFINGASAATDQICETLNEEINLEEDSPFMGKLSSVVSEQIGTYRQLIDSHIEEHDQEWKEVHVSLVSSRKACVQLEETAMELRNWRAMRRSVA